MELVALLGDRAEQVAALTGLGRIALCLGEEGQAARSLREALRLAREMSYMQGRAMALCGLGDLACLRNEWASATNCYTQGLELVKTTNDRLMMISLLHGLGEAARGQGRNALACAQLKQSLHLAWEIGNHVALTAGIEALARLCVQIGQPEHGAFLHGAAHELRENLQTPLAPVYREAYARDLDALRDEIGLSAFNECWAEGRSLLLKQVMALGVARVYVAETAERASPKAASAPYRLTARELDVLRLLAEGHPDARIAKLLVVSPRTVNTHLRSIYGKLGVSSRSAATRIALEQGLV
jgi:DNA-binding CsgD family transcriptional regulator